MRSPRASKPRERILPASPTMPPMCVDLIPGYGDGCEWNPSGSGTPSTDSVYQSHVPPSGAT
jgi:hypothetical protein